MATIGKKLQSLKETLTGIADLIKRDSKVIYIDYPIHFNKGDLAIYHGTEHFFKENNIEILERYNIHNVSYTRIKHLIKKYGSIQFLRHGGGNMGDTYLEKAENKRRMFIETFSDQEIIFLPQSIHYKDKINLKNSVNFYNNKNITLLVRDTPSFDLIKKWYPEANNYLYPDMAHYLTGTDYLKQFDKKDVSGTVVIARIDEEKIDKTIDGEEGDVIDWLPMTTVSEKMSGYVIAGLLKFLSFFNCNSTYLTRKRHESSLNILSKGFDKISGYEFVTTDRLHGFIMSSLLHKDITTSDNYYGKITNYKNTWF